MIPRISIMTPVFNAALFLEQMIESVQRQSFEDWELILVDDYSMDDSYEICERFCKGDKRIKLFKNLEKGIIPALKLAFEQSKGEYITRMDADDIMPDHKLTRLMQGFSGKSKEIVTGKVRYFSAGEVSKGYRRYEDWLNKRVEEKDHFQQIYRECVIASPNWLVHRSCFEEDILIENLIYPEDYDMVLKWYEKGYHISTLDEITHFWREHPKRTSRNSEDYQQQAFFHLKTHRFVELEIQPGERVQIIGSGIKSKLVREILESRGLFYSQFDLEGKHNSLSQLDSNTKAILTVWPIEKKVRQEICAFMKSKGFEFGKNCWLF